jgi:oligopeptide transport system substrate-binding protein
MQGAPDVGEVGLGYDLATARAQLQEYLDAHSMTLEDFNALSITLRHNTSEGHAAIAAAVQQDWVENLGVSVTVEHMDWATYLDSLGKSTPLEDAPHIFHLGWCADYPDENNWIHDVFHNEAGVNRFRRGCVDGECTEQVRTDLKLLTEQAKQETDPAERKSLYLQAEKLLAEEDVSYIPLYFYSNIWATKPYLERNYHSFIECDIATWRITQASTVVETDGGELTSDDGDTNVHLPSGAVTDTVVITHTPATGSPPGGNLNSIGNVFDLTAVYSDTGQEAQPAPGSAYTVTTQYSETQLGPTVEDTLRLYWWDEGANEWSQQGITSSVNVTDDVVAAQVAHFSRFAVLGETHRVYLPVVMRNY